MSYYSWHWYGYGICTDDIMVESTEKIEEMISCLPELQKNIHEYFAEYETEVPTVDDYKMYDDNWFCGLAGILQEVILKHEGIRFTACDDVDGNQYLIYEPRYPWNIQVEDRDLTEEKLEKIIQKYVGMLSDKSVLVTYHEVMNGG